MRSKEIGITAATFVTGAGLGYAVGRRWRQSGEVGRDRTSVMPKQPTDPIADSPFTYDALPGAIKSVYGTESRYGQLVTGFSDFLREEQSRLGAVSYTHLTLPTKRIV